MKEGPIFALLLSGCLIEVGVGDNLGPPVGPAPPVSDLDQDGFSVDDGDCDDLNPHVGPQAGSDPCDGVDNDCDLRIDETPDGVDTCARQDVFDQTLKLDLLVVIDSSESMRPFLHRAADGVSDLLAPVVGPSVDSHLGVLTMDLEDPRHAGRLVEVGGRRWLEGDRVTPETARRWLDVALRDNEVLLWGEEGGRAAVSRALVEEADAWNAGFARPDAHLVLVFLSDEEDASPSPTVPELLDLLADQRGSIGRVTVHAVVQLDGYDCDGTEAPDAKGASYLDLVEATAGTSLSVCEADFGPFLSAVGQFSATEGLGSRFPLGAPADPDSVRVTLELPGGLLRELSAGEFALTEGGTSLVLLLDPLPVAGSRIVVDYSREP